MIKLVTVDDVSEFRAAVIRHGDVSLEAFYYKTLDTGVIFVHLDEGLDEFPFGEIVTLTINDGANSSYKGTFNIHTNEFSPLA